MLFGMGLNKNRHGTYEARKKVALHLEEAVARVLDNGKPKQVWLKRTLATKDFAEAKRRVKAVQIEFDRILERAKWFGRYIGAHGITDSSKVFHSFRHSFVDALRLGGVNGEINMALLGHTDPSVHDK